MRNSVTKRIALSGLFLALALIVSLIENLIPPVIPALPYAKLGLGNVVLLACFLLVGVGEGCVVLVLKCFFAALFSGNLSALIWSLPAAAVAYAAMVILSRTRLFSVTGLSVAGGMLHNMTQILISMAVVGEAVVAYMPYMLLAGGLAGVVTGVICHFVVAFAERNSLTLRHRDVYRRLLHISDEPSDPDYAVGCSAADHLPTDHLADTPIRRESTDDDLFIDSRP